MVLGKVTKLLKKMREKDTRTLMKRFKHILRAQAIREYMAAKPDEDLNMEVRLTEEELLRRQKPESASIVITKKIK